MEWNSTVCFSSQANMSSVTFTLSGNSSVLTTNFFPPIELSNQHDYECGLIDFQSYHSIPNIDEHMNKISIGSSEILIPTGTYEIDELNKFIKLHIPKNETFELSVNKNTLHCEILSSLQIDFIEDNTIAPLLGFNKRKLQPHCVHISDNLANIFRVDIVRIECDLIKGSYLNHKKTHTLHEFFPKVAPGFKIIESPRNVIYFPINKSIIDSISLSFLDQNNQPINFRGESITVRVHIRRINV